MLSQIAQGYIVVSGVITLVLFSGNPKWHKLVFTIALLGQWAWFYTTYANEQWGMFAMTFFYTAMQIKGIHYRRNEPMFGSK